MAAKTNGIAFTAVPRSARSGAPSILFVHGSGLTGAFWDQQLSALSRHMHTLAIDLPGHGQSDAPALDSVAAYAAVLMDFIRTRGLPRPVPCGLSLGGAIVLQMLIDYPAELAGGILIGTGARLRVRPEIFDRIAGDYPAFVAAAGSLAAAPETADELLAPVRELMAACPPEVTAADYRACDGFDVMDRLGEIDHPVLVIGGADDQLTPVKYGDYLVRHIHRAQRCVVPRAGHLVPVEQPAAVNEAIRRFVSGHW